MKIFLNKRFEEEDVKVNDSRSEFTSEEHKQKHSLYIDAGDQS